MAQNYTGRYVSIGGASELEKVLKKLPKEVGEQVMISALRSGAGVIKKEAKATAPRGVGKKGRYFRQLFESITVRKVSRRGETPMVKVSVGDAFWGMFQEFGTRFHGAQPWLRPAFDATQGNALAKIGKQLGKAISKAAVKLAGSYATSGLKNKSRRRKR